ncbi:hypothetical protein K469DRAFT_594216, partial [Zopfia rhizophila CBS 207.26]
GHEVVVKLLMDKVPEVDSKGKKDGRTLLLWAAERGHWTIFNLLVEKGAEVGLKDSNGRRCCCGRQNRATRLWSSYWWRKA